MLDTIFGLPTHTLVNHVVLVLLPLAAVAAVVVALVPPWRRRYGPAVAVLTVLAVAAVPVATESGQRFYTRRSSQFGPDDADEAALMERHRDLAEQLLPWALVLLVGVLVMVLVPLLAGRRGGGGGGGGAQWMRWVGLLGIAVTLVGAVLTAVLTVRIGHAGTKAVWDRAVSSAPLGS
jgi:hypothetical protein